MGIRHFILTNDGRIEEFSEHEASQVANGASALSRFADSQLRYVQVAYDEETDSNGELKVRTMGEQRRLSQQQRRSALAL